MASIHVLMFGWEFPPNISGGLGTACYGIVKGLSVCSDVQVTFVVPKASGKEQSSHVRLISADQIATGYENLKTYISGSVKYLEVSSSLVPYLSPEGFTREYHTSVVQEEKTEVSQKSIKFSFTGQYGPNLFDEINQYAIVAQTIAQNNEFDLIHAHDWLTYPAGIIASKISGKPLVIHVHSTDFDRSGGVINPSIFAIEKQGMEHADRIITVSNLIKNRLVEQYNIPASKITTVYNAVEPEIKTTRLPEKRNKKTRIVTFLGRITIQKGPEYFVEVARLIISRMKNVHFVMAGNGELREKIIDLCVRFGISDRFHFTGFLKGPEVSQLLQRSDLFIMPSVSEPFGIVPLEAMQASVPVIISLQSGVSELVKHVIKTDFWDVHAMADAVHAILKHKKLSDTLITEGKKEVSRFNWEYPAQQIRQIYLGTVHKQAC